jgi:hypothetical protein
MTTFTMLVTIYVPTYICVFMHVCICSFLFYNQTEHLSNIIYIALSILSFLLTFSLSKAYGHDGWENELLITVTKLYCYWFELQSGVVQSVPCTTAIF